MTTIQVDTNNKAIMLNNKALLAQEFIGIPRELVNGTLQPIQTSHTYTLPDSVLHLGDYALYSAFNADKQLRGIDFNNLTDITGVYCLCGVCTNATRLTSVDFGNVTSINTSYAMSTAFSGCTALTDVDFSSLTSISGTSVMSTAFRNTGLVNFDLSSVTSVVGVNSMNATFRDCASLTSADFSSVTWVNNNQVMANIFTNCTSLTSVDFGSLETIGADTSAANYGQFTSAFNNCSSLTTLTFPELTAIYCTGSASGANGTFANNNYVQKMYFPKLGTITYGTGASSTNRNACKNVFYGCSALTELHFAAANQSAIEATDGYSTAWGRGAGNVTIYFDLQRYLK